MDSENSKTSEPYRLLVNPTDKINLTINNKYVPLSNPNICYTWKNKENSYTTINLKYQPQRGTKKLIYLTDCIQYQIFKIILSIL